MVYYTDEQRARAARSRRNNRRKRALVESPEDAHDILNDGYREAFGISLDVPKVADKPTIKDYGLPAEYETIIREHDKKSIDEKKQQALNSFYSTAIVLIIITVFACIYSPALIIFAAIVLPFTLLMIYASKTDDIKPARTNLHTDYEKYKRDYSNFQYWDRKGNIKHWNKLDGHEFERSVASLFRVIGFEAVVSRRGGDGGVDIILTKGGRKIAVQCKRYDKSVGPHVIRDLWGTMNALGISEGCIVTTTGFTSGVKSFAVGKNIFLIDLNDILRATGEGGDAYLRKKIGEPEPVVSIQAPAAPQASAAPPVASKSPHPRTYSVYRCR
jgi:HJR/Mrr/RecB family endonuclease